MSSLYTNHVKSKLAGLTPSTPPPTHTHTHTFLQEKGEGEVGKWLFKVRLLQNITSSSHMQGELVQKTLNEMEHSIKRIARGYKLLYKFVDGLYCSTVRVHIQTTNLYTCIYKAYILL